MNLLPVGAPVTPPGETPTAPIEGGETADIGFAALIAGLMAGDQQIVPTVEPAPVTREDGLEAPIGSTEADDIIGQFSLPPVELDPKKTDVVGGSVDRATAPTQISYSATSLTKPSHDGDPTTGPTELLPSPTVTSGSEFVPTNLAQLEGDTAPAADTVSQVAPHAAVAASNPGERATPIPPTEDSVTPVEATPPACDSRSGQADRRDTEAIDIASDSQRDGSDPPERVSRSEPESSTSFTGSRCRHRRSHSARRDDWFHRRCSRGIGIPRAST